MLTTADPAFFARLFVPVANGGHWHRPEHPTIPKAVSLTESATVEVNEGRWLVRCPFCPGAQLAHRDDHRFFCVDCLNGGIGMWLPVVWPKAADKIEAALTVRPEPRTRNWTADETVDGLLAENEVKL